MNKASSKFDTTENDYNEYNEISFKTTELKNFIQSALLCKSVANEFQQIAEVLENCC